MIKKIGTGMLISAIIIGIPNYLWMLGLIPNSPKDVMEARWVYQSIVGFYGFCIIAYNE